MRLVRSRSHHPRHHYSVTAKIDRSGESGARRSRGMGRHDGVVLQAMRLRLERAVEAFQEAGAVHAVALKMIPRQAVKQTQRTLLKILGGEIMRILFVVLVLVILIAGRTTD